MKRFKRICLLSSTFIGSSFLPAVLLSASSNPVIASENTSGEVAANVVTDNNITVPEFLAEPDQVIKGNSNGLSFVFSNEQSYKYNLKYGQGTRTNYYFNPGAQPEVYQGKDKTIANLKMLNPNGWQDEEQEWELTLNRNATFAKEDIGGYSSLGDRWSRNPRFGILISRALELVPDTFEIITYKTTWTEEELSRTKVARMDNKPENLQFSQDVVVNSFPHPASGYRSGKIKDLYRWTSYYHDGQLVPTWKVIDEYKKRAYSWDPGYGVGSDPVRASFLNNWQLPSAYNNGNYGYPLSNERYKILNDIGTIIGMKFDTPYGLGFPDGYTDQNWFKIKFKTRLNELLFTKSRPNPAADNLGIKNAYVLGAFTTYDWSYFVQSVDYKIATVTSQDIRNYSVDLKEFKQNPDISYQLPNASFVLKYNGKIVDGSSFNNSKDENASKWWTIKYGSIDISKSREVYDNLDKWELEVTFKNTNQDFWIVKQNKVYDPATKNVTFNLEYVIDEIKHERNEAIKALESFENLNQAQKSFYKAKINEANTIDDLRNLIDINNDNIGEIKNLDDKMVSLKLKKQEARDFLDNRANLINKTERATLEGLIDQINADLTSDTNAIDNEKINSYIKQVDDIIAKVFDAKFKEYLKTLNNLNDIQKQLLISKFDEEVAAGKRSNNDIYEEYQQKASSLDKAMETLNEKVASADDVKNNSNYINANHNKKEALDNALNNATSKLNNPLDLNEVNSLAAAIETAKNNLDGNINLAKAKNDINAKIDAIDSLVLSASDKAKLKEKVNAATVINNSNSSDSTNWNSTNSINEFVDKLASKLSELKSNLDKDASVKASKNYTNSNENKRQAYDNAASEAKAWANNPNKAASQSFEEILNKVSSLNNDLETALANLDGNDELTNAKAEAISLLEAKKYLNSAQKQALKKKINATSNLDELNVLKNNINSLDNAMHDLINAVDMHSGRDANDAKGLEAIDKASSRDKTDKFLKATNKAAYLAALDKAKSIIASSPELSLSKLNQAKDNINLTYQALNGDSVKSLSDAKEKALNTISNLPYLNNYQKEALKEKVRFESSLEKVKEIESGALKLNSAMKTIQDSLKLDPSRKASDKYRYATNASDYDQTLAKAQKINQGSRLINELDPVNVLKAQSNLEKAYSLLNGQTVKNLIDAKENANEFLENNSSNLNNSQKEELKDLIDNANSVDQIAKIKDLISKLNDAMDKLNESLNLDSNRQTEDKFIEASNQNDYLDAISKAKEIKDRNSLNVSDILEAKDKIENAYNNLDGNVAKEIRDAKENASNDINNLPVINNAQKEALKDKINSATTKEEIDAIIDLANKVNEATKDLINSVDAHSGREANPEKGLEAISEEQARKNSDSFKNAKDPQSYLDALKEGQELLNSSDVDSILNVDKIKDAASKIENAYKKLAPVKFDRKSLWYIWLILGLVLVPFFVLIFIAWKRSRNKKS